MKKLSTYELYEKGKYSNIRIPKETIRTLTDIKKHHHAKPTWEEFFNELINVYINTK